MTSFAGRRDLRFSPGLDPLARRLRLTCTGPAERITIDVDLAD